LREKTYTFIDKGNIHEVDEVLVINLNGTQKRFPLETRGQDKWLPQFDFPFIVFNKLPNEYDSAVTALAENLKELSYDDLLARYAGRRNYTQVFNDSGAGGANVTLGALQIGNKFIDAVQLEEVFEEAKRTAYESSRAMLHAFPEWTVTPDTSPEEESEILFDVAFHALDIIYAYIYFNKWYQFQIGTVLAADIFYGKQTMFTKKPSMTDLQCLRHIFSIFNLKPWGPDHVYTMSYFQAHVLYFGTDCLRAQQQGFDLDALSDSQGALSMGTIIEYLIRTFEGDDNYLGWFNRLGFVSATAEFPARVPLRNRSMWDALRSAEEGVGNKTNVGFLTVLFSHENKQDIIIANSPAEIIFGNAKKLFEWENRTPAQLASVYAQDSVRGLTFLWDMGTEAMRSDLTAWVNSPVAFTFDTGELINRVNKDFNDPDNSFCHGLMRSMSLETSSWMTSPTENGVAVGIGGKLKALVVLIQNSLGSEYTISHEVIHRFDNFIVFKNKFRYSKEQIATLFQNDNETIHINFYFDSTAKNWNALPPEHPEELASYTRNYLDLLYIWNLEKAKLVFRLPLEEQLKHVYIGEFSNVSVEPSLLPNETECQLIDALAEKTRVSSLTMTARRATQDELLRMSIDPDADDFMTHIFKQHIILPSNTTKDEYVIVNQGAYQGVAFHKDAYFNIPYTGGEWVGPTSDPTVLGFTYLWSFAAIAANGWVGLHDFHSDEHGRQDVDVLPQALSITVSPEDYLLACYHNVEQKMANNALKLYTRDEVRTLVENNLDADAPAKSAFIAHFMENTNTLFESIYRT
jgi:hypothetical protein